MKRSKAELEAPEAGAERQGHPKDIIDKESLFHGHILHRDRSTRTVIYTALLCRFSPICIRLQTYHIPNRSFKKFMDAVIRLNRIRTR
jgi:hypothetical protein